MTIDIRAIVTCSAGDVISADISSDYIQGNGVLKCSGSITVLGAASTSFGDSVSLSWSGPSGGGSIPFKLYCLGTAYDPQTNTTEVTVGCHFTREQEAREPAKLTSYDTDPDVPEEDREIVTIPMRASDILDYCLEKIGLSGGPSLTNEFSISEFDFSRGYVSIINDLLISENYCGYVDGSGNLSYIDLSNALGSGGGGFDVTNTISVTASGIGAVPGETVVVTYDTLTLKTPEIDPNEVKTGKLLWEYEEIIGAKTDVGINVKGEQWDGEEYEWNSVFTFIPKTEIETSYDNWDRVTKRVETRHYIGAETLASYIQATVKSDFSKDNIIGRGLAAVVTGNWELETITTTDYFYKKAAPEIMTPEERKKDLPEDYDELISERTEVTDHAMTLACNSPLKWEYEDEETGYIEHYNPVFGQKTAEITEITYEKYNRRLMVEAGDGVGTMADFPVVKTVQKRTIPYSATQFGQQDLANRAEQGQSTNNLIGLTQYLVDGGVETRIVSGREATLQARPPLEQRITQSQQDPDDPNNGYSTPSRTMMDLISGASGGARIVEFNMPYAPDDRFIKNIQIIDGEEVVTFTSVRSDAQEKAQAFGRVQSDLLMGTRCGVNVQTGPWADGTPGGSAGVSANGYAGAGIVSGTSWSMDKTGVVINLGIAIAGGAGGGGAAAASTFSAFSTFSSGSLPASGAWFPVAPGITELPPAPPVINNQMTWTDIVPMYNIRVPYIAKTRTRIKVQSFGFELNLPVVNVAIKTKTAVNTSDIMCGTLPVSMEANVFDFGYGGADTSSIMLHFDGTDGSTVFTDSSVNNNIPLSNVGTAALTTAFKKWGTASGDFIGTYDAPTYTWTTIKYLLYYGDADGPLDIGTFSPYPGIGHNRWTIEFWMYLPTLVDKPSTIGVFQIGNSTSRANSVVGSLALKPNNIDYYFNIRYFNSSATTPKINGSDTTVTVTPDQWHHVAVTFIPEDNNAYAAALRVFIDGVAAQDPYVGGAYNLLPLNTELMVGTINNRTTSGQTLIGGCTYIDDFRITKGTDLYSVFGVGTSHTIGTSYFTPPTAAFTGSVGMVQGYSARTSTISVSQVIGTHIVSTMPLFAPAVVVIVTCNDPNQAGWSVIIDQPVVPVSVVLPAPIVEAGDPDTLLFHLEGFGDSIDIWSEPPNVIKPTILTPSTGGAYNIPSLQAYQSKFFSKSLYFDGPIIDTLPIDPGTAGWVEYTSPYVMGTSDFCIEFWVYNSSLGAWSDPGTVRTNNTGTLIAFGNGHSIDIDYVNNEYLIVTSGPPWSYVTPHGPVLYDQWQHIAVYRINGSIYIAVDGNTIYHDADGQIYNITDTQHVWGDWRNATTAPDGSSSLQWTYIDEVRIRYTNSVYSASNFVPPTAPFGNISPTILHLDGSLFAESPYQTNISLIGGSSAIGLTSSRSKFGSASLYVPGSDGSIVAWGEMNIHREIHNEDFCIEFWAYIPTNPARSNSGYATFYAYGVNGDGSSIDFSINDLKYINYIYDPVSNISVGSDVPGMILDQWQHIAIYRIDGVCYFALDGIVHAHPTYMLFGITGLKHILMNWGDPPEYYYLADDCYMDEIRIHWLSSPYGTSNFTPPTSPF